MPIVRIDMLSGRTNAQKQEIARIFSEELSRIAHCDIGDVQVVFLEIPKESWAVGGELVSARTAAPAL